MALTIDPLTSIINVPTSYLTLDSGTLYTMDTDQFRLDLKGIEDDTGGIIFLKTHNHNTEVTIAGTTYARAIAILAPYSVQFEDGQYSVILQGSNNNIFDVASGFLVQNQVQVIPTNSAGLVTINTGSGVSPQDILDIADQVWDEDITTHTSTDSTGEALDSAGAGSSPADIADAVWDETLTAASHNDPTSAGRRLRSLAASVIRNELAQSAGVNGNQIILDTGASSVDGAYDPALVAIIAGTGSGQTRLILQYEGSTKTATVDRNWKVIPDATSEFIIVADAGREHINEGLMQGASGSTVTLNALASDQDNAYKGQVIFIRSGQGEDQARRVVSYVGSTKVATLGSPFPVTPDSTSAYVMLPTGTITPKLIADSVWDSNSADHSITGTFGELVRKQLLRLGSYIGLK